MRKRNARSGVFSSRSRRIVPSAPAMSPGRFRALRSEAIKRREKSSNWSRRPIARCSNTTAWKIQRRRAYGGLSPLRPCRSAPRAVASIRAGCAKRQKAALSARERMRQRQLRCGRHCAMWVPMRGRKRSGSSASRSRARGGGRKPLRRERASPRSGSGMWKWISRKSSEVRF